MVKQTLRVADMHCPNCAMKIESLEDDLPGVTQVDASYKKGLVEVEYDEEQVDLEQIIGAIKRVGYTATI